MMNVEFSRRSFLKTGAAALLGGMSVLLTGCDSSDSPFMPCGPDDVFDFTSSQAVSQLSCSSMISRETVNGQEMMGIELFLYTAQNSCSLSASCFSCELPSSSQPITCKLLKLHNRDADSISIGEQVMLTRGYIHSVTAYFPYIKTSALYTFTDGGQAIQFKRSGSSKNEPFLTTGVYDVSTGP